MLNTFNLFLFFFLFFFFSTTQGLDFAWISSQFVLNVFIFRLIRLAAIHFNQEIVFMETNLTSK